MMDRAELRLSPFRLLGCVSMVWALGGCPGAVADLGENALPAEKPGAVEAPAVDPGPGAPMILHETEVDAPAEVPRGEDILPPSEPESAPAPAPRLDDVPPVERLEGRIQSHFEGAETRRMHVQIDRPLYRPGETLWLRAWDLRTHDLSLEHEAVPGVTVSLLDPRGSVTVRKRFPVEGGLAAGDLDVPAGVSGGEYTLRVRADDGVETERPVIVAAYEPPQLGKELELLRRAHGPGDEVTASVKVLRPTGEPLAHRTITAVATVDGETLPRMTFTTDARGAALVRFDLPERIARGDGLLTILAEDGGITESISRSIPIVLRRMELRLLPEGGDLVTGLPSRIYFQAFDSHGQPADIAGRIVDDLGNTAARFESHHHGLGRFGFTPSTGRTYHAEITRPVGIGERYPVPVPADEGCVLRTFDDLDGTLTAIRASVRCTEAQTLIVSATQRERFLDVARVAVPAGEAAVVHLEPGDPALARAQGVARVTVFDDDLVPLAERIVYRNRRSRLDIEVTPHRSGYGPREKVTLTVRTRDLDGKPVPAQLALSVADDALLRFTDDKTGHLLSRILLEPEVPGEVKEPNLYLDLTDARSALALELLMGARGWRRFSWEPVLAPEEVEAGPRAMGAVGDSVDPIGQGLRGATIGVGGIGTRGRAGGGVALGLGGVADGEPAIPPGFHEVPLGVEGDLESALFGRMPRHEPPARGLGANVDDAIGGGPAPGDLGGLDGQAVGDAGGLGGLGLRGRTGGAGDFGAGGGGLGAAMRRGRDIRIAEGQPAVHGALDRELIRRVVRANRAQIRYCYERELQRTPSLHGRVAVRFTIADNGSVTEASVDRDTLGSDRVGQCLVSRLRTWQFPEPRGGGIVRVVYPFTFQSEPARDYIPTQDRRGRPAPAARALQAFAPVRTFPTPIYDGLDDPREDFRPTVFWSPSVRTRENGEARVSFYLSDAVTAFRVTTEGVAGGLAGRDETTFQSALPFDVTARLPLAVTSGDRIDLPITVANRGDDASEVSLRLDADAGLDLVSGERNPLTLTFPVTADERATRFVSLAVTGGAASRSLRIDAAAGTRQDDLVRTLQVASRGFPGSQSISGRVAGRVRQSMDLTDAVPGTLEATVSIHPSPVSSLVAGLEGMLRIPSGCFEQTSSSNHPNVLILRLLAAHDLADPALVARSRRHLEAGYRRLVSFESPSHGFEWFGADPASPVLSAYALVQLTDMKAVYDGVDDALITRTARAILDARDGSGGFRHQDGRGGRYARASDEVTAAYVTYALVRAGHARGLGPELRRQRARARATADPYVLALAAATLARLDGRSAEVRTAARRLAALQHRDGSWPGADHSITRSGGHDLKVETTALAILTLIEVGGHDDAVARGVAWLEGARRHGRWGATQATVLALEALARHAETRRDAAGAGRILVRLNGRQVASESFGDSLSEPLRVSGLGEHLRLGENVFEIVNEGGVALPYEIDVGYRTRAPASSEDAPVILETSLSHDTLKMGETVRLIAEVRNPSHRGLPMTLVRIGLPGGLESQPWQLREHREQGVADFFETGPQEVVVYFRSLAPGETRTVPLDLVAAVPGHYEAPASSAYLYYTDRDKFWAPPVSVVVARP